MKRLLCLSAAALLGLASSALGDPFACCNHGIHCICPPEDCPDCSCPCDHRFHLPSPGRSERAHKLIEQLSSDCACDRIKAAGRLGCRLHADFCCDPEVLSALVHALQCDPCWEVRKAAAWAIAYQGARTEQGVMALYLASKIDPHYLVRDAANDALGVLIVCRRGCFTEVFAAADALAKQLKGKYRPGGPDCAILFDACVHALPGTPVPAPAPKMQHIPAPMPKGAALLHIDESLLPRAARTGIPGS
jgi:hypothetical protein